MKKHIFVSSVVIFVIALSLAIPASALTLTDLFKGLLNEFNPQSSSQEEGVESQNSPGGLGEYTYSGEIEQGPAAVFPPVSAGAGDVTFQKVFFDNTDNPNISYLMSRITTSNAKVPRALDLEVASFGSKTYLFQLTGTDVWVYDVSTDPFNPTLVQGGDLNDQSLGAFASENFGGEYATQMNYLQVADNVPYGIVGGGVRGGRDGRAFFAIFNIDPSTGNISYVHRVFGSGAGLLPQEGGGIFTVGNATYVVGKTAQGALGIFDFSNPQSLPLPLIHEFPYPYMDSSGNVAADGATSAMRFMNAQLVFVSGQVPYLLMDASSFGSYNDEGHLHSMTNWLFLWDISNPSSPRLIDSGKTKDKLSMREYLTTSERGLALVYPKQYTFDKSSQDLYAIAGIVAGNTTPIGGTTEQLEVANQRVREAQGAFRSRIQLGAFNIISSGLSKLFVAPLAEGHLSTYQSPEGPRVIEALGGVVGLEYFSDPNTFSQTKNCSAYDSARFAYQQNGTIVYLTQEGDAELLAFRNNIKNSSGKVSDGYQDQCTLIPSASAFLRVDDHTIAAYRAKTLYVEVDKVTVSGTIPQSDTGGATAPSGTARPRTSVPSSGNSTPPIFSIDNLRNTFLRLLGQ